MSHDPEENIVTGAGFASDEADAAPILAEMRHAHEITAALYHDLLVRCRELEAGCEERDGHIDHLRASRSAARAELKRKTEALTAILAEAENAPVSENDPAIVCIQKMVRAALSPPDSTEAQS
jgi:hypothetical protein